MIQSLNCLRFLSCLNHLISVIKRTTKDCLCDFFSQNAHLLNLSDTSPTFFPFSSFKFWSQMTTFRKCSGGIMRCNCFSYINLLVHLCEANVKVKAVSFYLSIKALADTGVLGMRACPLSAHFFQNNMFQCPPPPTRYVGVGAPPSGKSWIRRHWTKLNVVGKTENRELIRDLTAKS